MTRNASLLFMKLMIYMQIFKVTSELIGWFPCGETTFGDKWDPITNPNIMKNLSQLTGECATNIVPLCYPSVCEDSNNRTIDVFIKRRVAKQEASTAPTVWFIQGGPGVSSINMESSMSILYSAMRENVNVYTIDHRGTGRSTLFDCITAQVTTEGSLLGRNIAPEEVPACSNEIALRYGSDLASFSVTSAALDILSFIAEYQSDGPTFIYGVSYGTVVLERMLHLLNNAEDSESNGWKPEKTIDIAGFVMDGIATASGSTDFEYFSSWDKDTLAISNFYNELCSKNSDCSARFEPETLTLQIDNIFAKIDDEVSSNDGIGMPACYSLLNDFTIFDSMPPSYTLRIYFGFLLSANEELRTLVPVLLYRLRRCDEANFNDIRILSELFNWALPQLVSPSKDDQYSSDLLNYLIMFSELWERDPTAPTKETLIQDFEMSIMSTGAMFDIVELYCAFTKDLNPTVCPYSFGNNSEYDAVIYKRDQYWNVSAAIPINSSVLIFSSLMDIQTPHKYAEAFFESLIGDTLKKSLVTFKYNTHSLLSSSVEESQSPITCGMKLLRSFVQLNGDLSLLDDSCVKNLPDISFDVPPSISRLLLGTNDAYDGKFDPTLRDFNGNIENDTIAQNSESKLLFVSYRTLFYLTLLFIIVYIILRLHKRRHVKKRLASPVLLDENVLGQSGYTYEGSRRMVRLDSCQTPIIAM